MIWSRAALLSEANMGKEDIWVCLSKNFNQSELIEWRNWQGVHSSKVKLADSWGEKLLTEVFEMREDIPNSIFSQYNENKILFV